MIKANVIIGHYQWKKKIKNPTNYFKSKLRKILKIPYFKTKKHEIITMTKITRPLICLINSGNSLIFSK